MEESTTITIPEPVFNATPEEIAFQKNIELQRSKLEINEFLLAPLVGPQTRFFLTKNCDITLMLGAAGSAKSFGGLLKFADAISKQSNEEFQGVAFRKTSADIRKGGSLLDSSRKVFSHADGVWNDTKMRWTFPNNATINLSHLQHEKDIESHLSAQYGGIFFDEIVQFSREQVFGLFGRLRSMSGIRPFLIGATNPKPDCEWIKELIMPHFVDDDGWARWENSGKIMYFYTDDADCYHKFWDEKEAQAWWIENNPYEYQKVLDGKRLMSKPTSLTCIPSLLEHNPELERIDPNYRQKMENMPYWEKMIYFYGNWCVAKTNSNYFDAEKIQPFTKFEDLPENMSLCRGYDLAYSRESVKNKTPDYTASVLMGKCKQTGKYYVLDARRIRGKIDEVEKHIRETALEDSHKYKQWGQVKYSIPQDAGAGTGVADSIVTFMDGYNIVKSPEQGSKTERFIPFGVQVSNDNVFMMKGDWNRMWMNELSQYPQATHDDFVDATSRCHKELAGAGTYDLFRCA